jgi:hypothetical protein
MSVLADVMRIAALAFGFALSAVWGAFLTFQIFRVAEFALEMLIE